MSRKKWWQHLPWDDRLFLQFPVPRVFAFVIPLSLLAMLLGVAIYADLRQRKIPNTLIFVGWLIALVWHVIAPAEEWVFDPAGPGSPGPQAAVLGAIALLVAFFPFYLLRIMGAGDVKLISVVGAFFGASIESCVHLFGVSLFVLAAGGVLALLRMAVSGSGAAVFANLRLIVVGFVGRLHGTAGPVFDPRIDSADRMPYAIAIALGTFAYLLGTWTGWIKP